MPTQNSTTQQIGQNLLYPIEDPNLAFNNALQDLGINTQRSNPFVEAMRKAAQGSRVSYLAQRAWGGAGSQGAQGSTGPSPSEGYGNFLRDQIGSGTLMNTMGMHADPGHYAKILDSVRAYQDQIGNGTTTATQINPYMSALNEIMSADNGRGALAAYGSLQGPMMGSLGSAYTRALSDFGDSAQRRFAREGNMNSDPWKWMF